MGSAKRQTTETMGEPATDNGGRAGEPVGAPDEARRAEVCADDDERTPEEAGYGYGV